LWAATEAKAIGRGGQTVVNQATKISFTTSPYAEISSIVKNA